MAEAVVGLLIGKLGAALTYEAAAFGASVVFKEASALKVLFGEIRQVKEELESMQANLRGAERLKDTDETTGVFIKRIRVLAFEMEDVIDEFTYKLEDKHGGFAAKMKKRIKHVDTWCRLALKLQGIRGRLRRAKQMKKDYMMTEMDRYAGAGLPHAKPTNQALGFTRDDDLVGIEENRVKLIHWLTGDLEEKRSKISTVWGMPGVGKTTLVAHVYNAVKVEFDNAAWVTVSKSYSFEDLLKKIVREFGIAADVANMEMRSMCKAIHNHLQDKSYSLCSKI